MFIGNSTAFRDQFSDIANKTYHHHITLQNNTTFFWQFVVHLWLVNIFMFSYSLHVVSLYDCKSCFALYVLVRAWAVRWLWINSLRLSHYSLQQNRKNWRAKYSILKFHTNCWYLILITNISLFFLKHFIFFKYFNECCYQI